MKIRVEIETDDLDKLECASGDLLGEIVDDIREGKLTGQPVFPGLFTNWSARELPEEGPKVSLSWLTAAFYFAADITELKGLDEGFLAVGKELQKAGVTVET